MMRQPEKDPVPLEVLAACCPEAQADGVPCPSLGRACEECERAIAIGDQAAAELDLQS